MGRIKTQVNKRITEELMDKCHQDFGNDFAENKKVLASKLKISSKKLRNVVAGYATKLKKSNKYD